MLSFSLMCVLTGQTTVCSLERYRGEACLRSLQGVQASTSSIQSVVPVLLHV